VPRSNSPELVNLVQQAKQYGQLKAKG
jgi:hypothetical protein